jgi:hypothetical protein
MNLQTLNNLEAFLLSDRVTIKGSEFMAMGQLVSAIQQDRDALLNAERVAARVRPKPVQAAEAASVE